MGLAILVPFLAPAPALSQTGESGSSRSLNGHFFIPSSSIGDPFISTFVRTQTGGGFATNVARDIDNPALDSLRSELVGDLAFMTLEFEYQHAVTDWLALSAAASGAGRVGTGAQSVLAQGVTSYFGFKLGAAARFHESEKWLFSGVARFQPTTQYRLDALTFVKRAIDEGQITEDNSLVLKSDGAGAALGVRGAYAPRDYLGFAFGAEVGYADTFDADGRDDPASEFGLLTSFDMKPLWGVPLGLIASIKSDGFVVENSDITEGVTTFGWGVAYTGRDDFSLGVEFSHIWVPLIQSDQTVTANLGAFNLKYFF